MRYLGIDVGKVKSTFYCTNESGKKICSGTIATNPHDFGVLAKKIDPDHEGLLVAIEVGTNVFPLLRAMEEAQADVFVVHPADNALIAQSRKKSDRLDAKTLAKQRRCGMLPDRSVYVPSAETELLRKLVSTRESKVKRRAAVTNSIRHLLHPYFGSLLPGRSALASKSGWERLSAFLETRANSVPPQVTLLAGQLIQEALLMCAYIRALEDEVERDIKRRHTAELELLKSIPGIGPINVMTVLAWGSEIERFRSCREFQSYAGLVPRSRQSGNRKVDGGTKNTGQRFLGKNLVQAAQSHAQNALCDDELHRWYQHVKRRRGWKKARVALARKLASIIYGVLKHKKPYDPKYLENTYGAVVA